MDCPIHRTACDTLDNACTRQAPGWSACVFPDTGTAPSALTHTTWQDMAAAVVLAMHHLQNKMGNRPVYIIGYSTGATLAIQYALSRLSKTDARLPQGLVLLTPPIGVTPLAALAVWQARVGRLLGLEKLQWNTVLPEYDPYKYNSFALNAGDQVYRLSEEIQHLMDNLDRSALERFPPTLAFQSVSDATINARDLVDKFFVRLPEGGHEIVIFDINRLSALRYLLAWDPAPQLEELMRTRQLPFSVSLLTNLGPDTRDLVIHHKPMGSDTIDILPTALSWPRKLYAISHVALPIPPTDPLYGRGTPSHEGKLQLGNLALRGEKGLLLVSGNDMLRLRWNPFYTFLEDKTLRFLKLKFETNKS